MSIIRIFRHKWRNFLPLLGKTHFALSPFLGKASNHPFWMVRSYLMTNGRKRKIALSTFATSCDVFANKLANFPSSWETPKFSKIRLTLTELLRKIENAPTVKIQGLGRGGRQYLHPLQACFRFYSSLMKSEQSRSTNTLKNVHRVRMSKMVLPKWKHLRPCFRYGDGVRHNVEGKTP